MATLFVQIELMRDTLRRFMLPLPILEGGAYAGTASKRKTSTNGLTPNRRYLIAA